MGIAVYKTILIAQLVIADLRILKDHKVSTCIISNRLCMHILFSVSWNCSQTGNKSDVYCSNCYGSGMNTTLYARASC